ncbi:MAG: DNA gyrase inhibitor YacG [Desulfuromonas sp.]|nr:DNA gyrase inhibitor YacG [Desulfuromonas sp.]
MVLQVQCPICAKKCAWEGNKWRPFCSERCRLIDLGAWIDEEYSVGQEAVNVDQDDEYEID